MNARHVGRWQLLVLLAGFLLPMLLATSMYCWQLWLPDSRTYHGQLIANGQLRADLGVQADEARWQLLVTAPGACTDDCRQLVYLARQINIGLGRDAGRASHALASPLAPDAGPTQWQMDYPQLRLYPLNLQRYRTLAPPDGLPRLWIIDPHGNLVLRYEVGVRGQDVLRDLRHLLKLSNIG